MKSVNPRDVPALDATGTDGAVLIDVREPDEVATVRIPGAVSLPMSSLNEHLGELPEGEFYVICHAGGRSAKVSQALEAAGHSPINVLGGITQWEADGLPVER